MTKYRVYSDCSAAKKHYLKLENAKASTSHTQRHGAHSKLNHCIGYYMHLQSMHGGVLYTALKSNIQPNETMTTNTYPHIITMLLFIKTFHFHFMLEGMEERFGDTHDIITR